MYSLLELGLAWNMKILQKSNSRIRYPIQLCAKQNKRNTNQAVPLRFILLRIPLFAIFFCSFPIQVLQGLGDIPIC
jgi:hypothetical protein